MKDFDTPYHGDLSSSRRALLDALSAEDDAPRRRDNSVAPAESEWRAIPRIAREPQGRPSVFPLSFAQQRLWFLDRLTPGKWYYNIPTAARIHARVSAQVLQRALDEMVRRHESLRTIFRPENGVASQVVMPRAEIPLKILDISNVAPAERETELIRLASEEARRPFQLDQGPLLRVTLLRLEDAEHVMLITMHHIISDGWSLNVFSRELSALYEAYATGRPASLRPPVVQYADFAVWQREWLSGDLVEKQLAWWCDRLNGAEPLRLWTDRPRPSIASFAGAYRTSALGNELAVALRALGRQERCTLFMTLLAGFTALLNRYTEQDEIVIGAPIAGRNRPELEQVIGFFVNTLVLRNDVSGDPTFRELLRRARDVSLDAWGHPDLPFEKLVEEFHPRRDLSRNPLFQVAFQLLNTDKSSVELTDAWREVQFGVAKFDLTFNLWEAGENIACQIEYSTDLYEESSIDRMAQHFRILLKSAVASPDTPVSRLNLLTAAEREKVLADWYGTARDYPRASSVDQLFAAQAALSPDAQAVEYAGASDDPPSGITYAELDRRSNQLANLLRHFGVCSGDTIGILLQRSPLLVTAMLGVLKAGATYVPLDVSFPAARVHQILNDCAAKLLLTTTDQTEELKTFSTGWRILCLDEATAGLDAQPGTAPPSASDGASIAYIMYTSGSTGAPKGARVPHRAISRLVVNPDYIALGPDERIAQTSNPAFDAAVFEIWGALLNGGCVTGIRREVMLSPLELSSELRKRGISTLFITTALFNTVARRAPWAFQPLKNVLFGGEMADPAAVRSVLRNGPPARLVHVYGPTENTTFSLWDVIQDLDEQAVSVPLGRAVANTRAVILDRHLQLVPIGIPGELYLAGDGLAVDYVNRPDLTAECFVDWRCPGGGLTADRLYRTGDLVKRLADGRIEFLGRKDQMVKIRGFRVEPGEIEALLLAHPLVRQAVVVAREAVAGDKRLIAYVARRDGAALAQTGAELRDYLRERVPEFMIPAAFVVISEMPLNRNGKVDRAMLPDPEQIAPQSPEVCIPPANEIENGIAGIWRETLRIARVGMQDNFFDLGGHSLLLIEVHSRIEQRFGIPVSITDLFQYPTITALAAHLGLARGRQETDTAAHPDPDHLQETIERARRQKLAIQQRTLSAGR